jgi:hypothetical protein
MVVKNNNARDKQQKGKQQASTGSQQSWGGGSTLFGKWTTAGMQSYVIHDMLHVEIGFE